MGRYIPPASEDRALASGQVGGFNSQKGHPLGSRFSKAKEGLITVRFEMPFDVWCEHCKPEFLIKQGVRFNAEKKKAGKYLSTPIWEFTFRHPPCSGLVSVKTDPENTRYVVSSGGRKKAGAPTTALDKDYGQILTEEERERRRNDAFAHLEGQNEDKVQEKSDGAILRKLYRAQMQNWDDPYTANQKLRREFRVGRKQREAAAEDKAAISERFSISIDLLDHTQEDASRAALIEYGIQQETSESVLAKPMFEDQPLAGSRQQPEGATAAARKQQKATKDFQSGVLTRTKAKMNPFGDQLPNWAMSRKKISTETKLNSLGDSMLGSKRSASSSPEAPAKTLRLVDYAASDDEAPD